MKMSRNSWICALSLGLLCASVQVQAQDTLLIAAGPEGPHLYHVVQSKENFYSLGRAYHLSPHVIASFNHLDMHQGLKVLQALKIPLTAENFSQSGTAASHAGAVPLYHRVLPGETLYRISHDYGDVPDAQLRVWNRLQGNDIHVGEDLLVGWLEATGLSQSPEHASTAAEQPRDHTLPTPAPTGSSTAAEPPAQEHGGGFLADVIASEHAKQEHSGSNTAAGVSPTVGTETTDAAVQAASSPAGSESTPQSVMTASDAGQPEAKPKPAAPALDSFAGMLNRVAGGTGLQPANTGAASASGPSLAAPASTNLPKSASPTPTASGTQTLATSAAAEAQASAAPAAAVTQASPAPAASDFAGLYADQTHQGAELQEQKGAGAWFKSNVEPGSGRYYALFNGAQRGAVLKVTNPLNGKAVYVKVLDAIPKLAGNYNLMIKISDAAMQDLGVQQARFWCQVSFAPSEAVSDTPAAPAASAVAP